MAHLVLSRKYRPQGFEELVGQEHVARILASALAVGRVGHAYLFVGPRGVGKTTSARIFAKAINCAGAPADRPGGGPCGRCPSCLNVTAGSDQDVVEIDAASNNAVDDVRSLREQVGYAPVRSPFRIWIVDEVHMLSTPAFNAFLKTLEEPPPHVKFLFCTTEDHKLPSTFRSRCQVVEFRPIAPAAMATRLEALLAREGATAESGVLDRIAAGALGGLRDAESLLEQLLAASVDRRVTLADYDALSGRAPDERMAALTAAVEAGDAGAALDAVGACLAGASKPGVLLDQWLEAGRRALSVAARGPDGGALARASRALDVLLVKRQHLRSGADGVLVLEAAAVELARLPHARDLDRLVEALRARAGASPASSVPPGPSAPAGPAAPTGGSGRTVGSPATVPGPGAALPGRPPAGPEPASVPPLRPGGAPSAPAAGPGSLTLPQVRAGWEGLIEAAGRRDARLRDALRRVEPTALVDGRLSLAVPAGDVMARSTLERREMQQAFRLAAREALGQELVPVTERKAEPASRGEAQLREHPEVRRVAESVGGRVLQVERDAGPPGASSAGGASSGATQPGAPV